MKKLSILLLLAIMASCGGPKAVIDYDSQANFNILKTYNIFPDINSGLSQLDEKRLYAALEEEMKANGFTKSSTPDVYVNVFTSQFEDVNRNRIGLGVGTGGGGIGVGVSGGIPIGGNRVNYLRFNLDIIDAKKDDLIWQAKLEERFNLKASPEKRAAFFEEIISKALKQYPPSK